MTKSTNGMTNAQLVELHNELNPEAPLSQWKGKKADLLTRIEALTPARTVRECSLEYLCKVAYHEDKTKDPGPDNVVDVGHANARSVGLPYDEVLAAVREEFPNCETTVACLRWYAVKVRSEEYEGYRLPQRRPRAKSKAD